MKVGFAIAGRHPGHYFLGDQVQKEIKLKVQTTKEIKKERNKQTKKVRKKERKKQRKKQINKETKKEKFGSFIFNSNNFQIL